MEVNEIVLVGVGLGLWFRVDSRHIESVSFLCGLSEIDLQILFYEM